MRGISEAAAHGLEWGLARSPVFSAMTLEYASLPEDSRCYAGASQVSGRGCDDSQPDRPAALVAVAKPGGVEVFRKALTAIPIVLITSWYLSYKARTLASCGGVAWPAAT